MAIGKKWTCPKPDCGHTWHQRTMKDPVQCPACKRVLKDMARKAAAKGERNRSL